MTDCLNYGNPEDPEVYHQFLEGVRGIREGAEGIGLAEDPASPIPIVSGNVSFYNESSRGSAIAPSPILCLLGIVPDASRATTIGVKRSGSRLLLVGERYDDLGGSLFSRAAGGPSGKKPPLFRPEEERPATHLVSALVGEGRVRAAHDIGAGGLLYALAEMLIASRDERLGARIDAERFGAGTPLLARLFGESAGFLLETDAAEAPGILERAERAGAPAFDIGAVHREGRLRVGWAGGAAVDLSVARIRETHREALASLFPGV